jgi:ABC-type uncharacterized transport system substrate-binding protein
MIDFRS